MSVKIKIDDAALRKLQQQIERGGHVKVGVLASKGGGDKHPDSDLSMVEIAAVHEFGSPAANIPQRSFLRGAFERKIPALQKITARLGKAVVTGKLPLAAGLELLGQWGVTQIQAYMVKGVPPRLAESTRKKRRRVQSGKKGRDVPLIDTGRLRQSIAYEVKLGGSEGSD